MSSSIVHHSFLLREDLSWNLYFLGLTRLLTKELQGSACFCLPSAVFRRVLCHPLLSTQVLKIQIQVSLLAQPALDRISYLLSIFLRGFYIAQASTMLPLHQKTTFNSRFSCLYLLSSGIINVHHFVQLCSIPLCETWKGKEMNILKDTVKKKSKEWKWKEQPIIKASWNCLYFRLTKWESHLCTLCASDA